MRRSESFDEAKLDQWLVRLRRGLLAELRMDATLTMIDLAARALEALDGATTANGQNPAIGTHAGTSQKCGEAHFALATE